MVQAVRDLTSDWNYEAVSIGFPGLVGDNGPRSEPGNLGGGWVGFDFAAAFGLPVRIVNDAVMQAMGSYEGGRMLFLGLGTGLGSALIAANVVVSLELGRVPAGAGQNLGDIVGRAGLRRVGKKIWREAVTQIATALLGAFVADYVVLGGGNAKVLKEFPPGLRLGHNLTAFRGGFRLWHLEDVPTLSGHDGQPAPPRQPAEWRVI
jgi:polyphosphate glucokinase